MLTLPLSFYRQEAGSTLVNVYLAPANVDPSPTLTMSVEGLHHVLHASSRSNIDTVKIQCCLSQLDTLHCAIAGCQLRVPFARPDTSSKIPRASAKEHESKLVSWRLLLRYLRTLSCPIIINLNICPDTHTSDYNLCRFRTPLEIVSWGPAADHYLQVRSSCMPGPV
jgi:hypothetical protein